MKQSQTRCVWSPEQKAEIVSKYLNDHISVRALEKEYRADRSMTCKWVKKYIAEGESSFVHTGHATASFTLDVYGYVTDQIKNASAARMEFYMKSILTG